MDGALKSGLVKMVAAALARLGLGVDAGCRKKPLPRPFAAGVRIVARDRARELHPAGAACEITLTELADVHQVSFEDGMSGRRQDRDAILGAFAAPHEDVVRLEIERAARTISASHDRSMPRTWP